MLYNKILKSILNFFNVSSLISEVTRRQTVMHHVTSNRLLTAGARFQFQASESRICGRWSGTGRCQWPRGLRRGSAAVRLLGLRVRIPPGGQECLSAVSVVYCQVEVTVNGRSLVQDYPNECGVSGCDGEASMMRVPGPVGAVAPWEGQWKIFFYAYFGSMLPLTPPVHQCYCSFLHPSPKLHNLTN
jgi:hypothetical protein